MEKTMTDNKNKESKSSVQSKADAQIKQGLSTSISKTAAADKKTDSSTDSSSPKAASKPTAKKEPIREKNNTMNKANNNPQKLSKTAVLSLLIALAASAGVAGLYYWEMQQQALTKQAITQQTQQHQQNLVNNQQKIKQLLAEQQTKFSEQLTRSIQQIATDSQIRITQLEKNVERLSQNQPSDWLLHEAEYLIRIATRTIWLEHDTQAAIGLLQDADRRLKELNDPQYLPIRQLIREDIAALKLMPALESEETIMTLMAMSNQLNNLPVKLERIPEEFETQKRLALSEDIADWKENLTKTWEYFSASFITVRRRSGQIEPLMSPQFQQNLRENLSLKLQLAQWATSKREQKLYDQTLVDIQIWLEQYFDMNAIENKNFSQGIQQLKNKVISFNYPSSLLSLKAIRQTLTNKPLKPVLDELITPPSEKPEDIKPQINTEVIQQLAPTSNSEVL